MESQRSSRSVRTVRSSMGLQINESRMSMTSRMNSELSSRSSRVRQRTSIPFYSVAPKVSRLDIQEKSEAGIPDTIKEEPEPLGDTKNLFVTFDLLRTMNPRHVIGCLNSTPIFLRTMFLDKKLDPEIISNLCVTLTQQETMQFVNNMTTEMNIYSLVTSCASPTEVEEKITAMGCVQRFTIWTKIEFSEYMVSSSLKAAIPIKESILGECFRKKSDVVTADPSNHEGFSITYDLPLLLGAQSMVLLPIDSPSGEVIAIIQAVGFKNPVTQVQSEFTQYYIEAFKIIRDIVKAIFFSSTPKPMLPTSLTSIFNEIERADSKFTARQIVTFLQNFLSCELAELFEYDDRYRSLTNLVSGVRLGEEEGGMAFQAGMNNSTYSLPNHFSQDDSSGKFTGKSIFVKSFRQGRNHFVIMLHSKCNSSAFTAEDSRLVSAFIPSFCDTIRLSRQLEEQKKRYEELERTANELSSLSKTMSSVATGGTSKWNAVLEAAKSFFGCNTIFLAVFDGRFMCYYPTELKVPFEDCNAGMAYNYRDAIWSRASDKKAKFDSEIYKKLGVNCSLSLCFPFRSGGKVVGAVEVINPKVETVPIESQKLFGNLCGCVIDLATTGR